MLHFISLDFFAACLFGFIVAGLVHFLNYCMGKPASDKWSPYEIFSFYTVWLSERRLRQVELLDTYMEQYNENFERAETEHQKIKLKNDFNKMLYDAADPFFTWERSIGMCPVCFGFWVALITGLVFTQNLLHLSTIIVISHIFIRLFNKIL